MATVVIIGGGVAGLGTALALAADGHEITVVERDDISLPPTPDDAFFGWPRRGAPQVHHSHAFLARLRNLLRDRNPALLADLLAAGATELRFTERFPDAMEDTSPRPGDEDLVALACRRTTFEWVLRRDALSSPRVRLVEAAVDGLVPGPAVLDGVPNVVGVRLGNGDAFRADWVIDASGRRSPLPGWIAALGGSVEEREEDTGIVYSSRFYRLADRAAAPPVVGPNAGDLGYLKFAVFVGDNRTHSVTFGVAAEDSELRVLLREPGFTTAARAVPSLRPWIDPAVAEPITGVEVMARLLNRSRTFVVDGRPVATGVLAAGDAHTCTNPLYGRGCSLAFVAAYLIADAIRDGGTDRVATSLRYEDSMRREVYPWYRASVAQDRQERASRGLPVPASNGDLGDGTDAMTLDVGSARSLLKDGLLPATQTDPIVFRAFLRAFNLLDPPEQLLRDPEIIGRVLTVWQDRDQRPPAPVLGPERDALLAELATSKG